MPVVVERGVRLAVVAGLVGLSACSPTGATPTSISGSPVPVTATGVAVVVTAVSTVQLSGPPSPMVTQGPLVSPAVLTDADNGAVVQLHVGDRVELRLSGAPALTWTVQVVDASILRQNGAFYEAVAPGTTTLSANGEPACRRVTPPCGLPNRLFQVQVDVSP
jgi:hypothetical protein